MNTKHLVWIGAVVGSAIGGYVPLLWGGDTFSFSSILFAAGGSIVGIYIGFKIGQEF